MKSETNSDGPPYAPPPNWRANQYTHQITVRCSGETADGTRCERKVRTHVHHKFKPQYCHLHEEDDKRIGHCHSSLHEFGPIGPIPLYNVADHIEYYDGEEWVCHFCLRELTPEEWNDE